MELKNRSDFSFVMYFATGAGNNAPGESAYYNCIQFTGFIPFDATHLDMYFQSAKGCNAVDTVRLTISSNTHKEVSQVLLNLIYGFAAHPEDVTIITVFDGDATTGQTINPNITGVAITYGECTGGSSGDTYSLSASSKVGANVPILLDAAKIKRIVSSATASFNTLGVLVTFIFFSKAELIDILSYPTPT